MPSVDIRRHVMDILAYRSLSDSDKIRRLTMMRDEAEARGGQQGVAVIREALQRLDTDPALAAAQ